MDNPWHSTRSAYTGPCSWPGTLTKLSTKRSSAARGPKDTINCNLLAVDREVKDGRRPRPKTLAELEG